MSIYRDKQAFEVWRWCAGVKRIRVLQWGHDAQKAAGLRDKGGRTLLIESREEYDAMNAAACAQVRGMIAEGKEVPQWIAKWCAATDPRATG